MARKKENKYEITKNKYAKTIFISLVIISAAYIVGFAIKSETQSKIMIDPSIKAIKNGEELLSDDDDVLQVSTYLNLGNTETSKIYQSMYNNNEEIKPENMSDEDMLYIAYKYIEKNTNLKEYEEYADCNMVNTNYGLNYDCTSAYKYNTFINKKILDDAVEKIFNRTIKNYTSFYTNNDNMCHFINGEYYCLSLDEKKDSSRYARVNFKNAYYDDETLVIIQNYYFVNNGETVNGFLSDITGSQDYISTFVKKNGTYHWTSTKPYNEN